jgi:hypothetical protein
MYRLVRPARQYRGETLVIAILPYPPHSARENTPLSPSRSDPAQDDECNDSKVQIDATSAVEERLHETVKGRDEQAPRRASIKHAPVWKRTITPFIGSIHSTSYVICATR